MKKNISNYLHKASALGQRLEFNLSTSFSTGQEGEKFGRGTGSSMEYFDHRNYQPGDDVRSIDWGVLARTDSLTVKLFKEEIAPEVELLIDGSLSMALQNSFKFTALVSLITVLRSAALNSGFKVTSWLIKDRCYKLDDMQLMQDRLPDMLCDYSGDMGKTLCTYPPPLKPRTIRFLLSDLFWPHSPTSVMRVLSHNAALLGVLQVTSVADESPDLVGNVRLVDVESRLAYEVVASSRLMSTYTENYNNHRNYWRNSCTKIGGLFTHLVDEEFLKDCLPVELVKSEVLLMGKG